MKVICIDASVRADADNTFLSLLTEGKTYTIEGVYKKDGKDVSYYFYEIPGTFPHSHWRIAYLINRFMHGSNIDEMILVNTKINCV